MRNLEGELRHQGNPTKNFERKVLVAKKKDAMTAIIAERCRKNFENRQFVTQF